MTLDVVVLGSSGTFPTADSASTGFLLRAGDTRVWLDAGTGTFANLQRHMDFFDVGAVVISHLHLDHVLDLYPFYYGLRYAKGTRGPNGIPIYAPDGALEFISKLVPEADDGAFDGYISFEPIADGVSLEIGSLKFTFGRSLHPIETLATRIESDGRVLGYTSDTGSTDSLVDLFKDANVLIAEATNQEPCEGQEEVHMTAREAGILARNSNAERLVLTHISPGLDQNKSVEEAAAEFSGEILVARDNLVLSV